MGHHLVHGAKLGQDDHSEPGLKYMPSESGHEVAKGRCLRTRAQSRYWGRVLLSMWVQVSGNLPFITPFPVFSI